MFGPFLSFYTSHAHRLAGRWQGGFHYQPAILQPEKKTAPTLYQEPAVFGKMKMDPTKRAQTQNAGEV